MKQSDNKRARRTLPGTQQRSSLSDSWTIIGAKRALYDWKDLSDRGCIPSLASYPGEYHTMFAIKLHIVPVGEEYSVAEGALAGRGSYC